MMAVKTEEGKKASCKKKLCGQEVYAVISIQNTPEGHTNTERHLPWWRWWGRELDIAKILCPVYVLPLQKLT